MHWRRGGYVGNDPTSSLPPAGGYQYMEDLQQLARAKPPELLARRPQLSEIHSPLRRKLPAWRQELRDHGDRRFAKYILDGIEHGFRVGFDHSYPLVPASRNMPSASSHAEVIDAYIAGEVAEGRC